MRVINADNTYAVRVENGIPVEGIYLSEGSTVITTDAGLHVADMTSIQVDYA